MTIERTGALADAVLDRSLGRAGLDARDRALALELVYGVLRHRSALDWRLAQVSNRPIERLPFIVKNALRLAAYQLLYLQRIPPSAAVNESVALVKSPLPSGSPKRPPGRDWGGFVNAVLRGMIRAPVPSWPALDDDPVTALSIRYSCPSWLTNRWVARFGAHGAERLCRATLEVPPLTIRANTLRLTREALSAELTKAGAGVRLTAVSPVGLVLDKCGSVTEIAQFREGLFYVEDEAGQLVAPILDPQPGERVLDACAAPGGKATSLAALMRNRGEVVAMDRSPHRLRMLQNNCRRLGVRIVSMVAADATETLLCARPFDRILLDVPCSGLGVLRRHPEGKWQKDERMLASHRATQRQMLERISRLLRPGGVLVYSTCSTEPDENEEVVEQFCREHEEFRRETVAPWLPKSGADLLNAKGDFSTLFNSHSMDVFFAARLRKAD
jgi:16S rRNA (cytosine967-C5)-methyltransferase